MSNILLSAEKTSKYYPWQWDYELIFVSKYHWPKHENTRKSFWNLNSTNKISTVLSHKNSVIQETNTEKFFILFPRSNITTGHLHVFIKKCSSWIYRSEVSLSLVPLSAQWADVFKRLSVPLPSLPHPNFPTPPPQFKLQYQYKATGYNTARIFTIWYSQNQRITNWEKDPHFRNYLPIDYVYL